MKVITAEQAKDSLQDLLEQTANSHEPIQIISVSSNGILIAEEDWRAIQETVYLRSIPGMRESIREGMNVPIEECSTASNIGDQYGSDTANDKCSGAGKLDAL